MENREDELREVNEEISEETERELKVRYQEVAMLAAQGLKQRAIADKLDYDQSQVSRILSKAEVKAEVTRLRKQMYEDTIATRLKDLANPAMDVIEECLTDTGDRFSSDQQAVTARWTVEQAVGKATQKFEHDIGGTNLALLMDRLDAIESAQKEEKTVVEVKGLASSANVTEEEKLKAFADRFSGSKT